MQYLKLKVEKLHNFQTSLHRFYQKIWGRLFGKDNCLHPIRFEDYCKINESQLMSVTLAIIRTSNWTFLKNLLGCTLIQTWVQFEMLSWDHLNFLLSSGAVSFAVVIKISKLCSFVNQSLVGRQGEH